MLAEEVGEVEQIVGIARGRGELTGRGWHNADALKKEIWRGSVTARRAASGEARLALRGIAGELVLVLGELYRTGRSDGLSCCWVSGGCC